MVISVQGNIIRLRCNDRNYEYHPSSKDHAIGFCPEFKLVLLAAGRYR